MNIGFLASHNGSNMQAIIDACKSGFLKSKPVVVISNNKNSGAILRAETENISYYHLSSNTHPNEEELDSAILNALIKHEVSIVILAGYMKKLGPKTLSHYKNAILNTHPALLPMFGGKGMYGKHVHEAVIASGEKETGITIHIVDKNFDTGRIIAQTRVPILFNDTPEILQARVLEREHTFFPETLRKIESGEISIFEK
jgi:phosphoribosylglycinamide formyltransferase 1